MEKVRKWTPRAWRIAASAFLVACLLPSLSSSSAADRVAELTPVFDKVVYGDVVVVGNTVTACPARETHRPAQGCRDARQRKGAGVAAQNNGYLMRWADVDADPDTYNSSSARFTIPAGAHIIYAQLSWAGDHADRPSFPCGGATTKPTGSPRDQAVSLVVNGQPAHLIKPDGPAFAEDSPDTLASTDERMYSATADVTGQFDHVTGGASLTITVGNIWTPLGYDCFGGWSLIAVWAFDRPTFPAAPAKRHVQVYTGHFHVRTDNLDLPVRLLAMRAAGGSTRIGVVAYEGDWAAAGDRFLVNGEAQAAPSMGHDRNNFFVSHADGAAEPDDPNNMSVDTNTIDVSDKVIRHGDTHAGLTFTSGTRDAYLVRSITVSSPLPELSLVVTTAHPEAHAAEKLAQTVRVTNTGGAPAAKVHLHTSGDPGCDHDVGTLQPGQEVTVTCTTVAQNDDYWLAATATGTSLVGDALTAEASTAVDVLHPAVTIMNTAKPDTVLTGQTVGYDLVIHNSGDTPLFMVAVDDDRVDACDRAGFDTLAPGQDITVHCSTTAGDEGFVSTATVTAKDKLGKQVTASGAASFTVLHAFHAATPDVAALQPPAVPVMPAAVVSSLPVPVPVILIGLSTVAMSITVTAVAAAARPRK